MRAILIDPEKRTFTEIQLDGDDYRKIKRVLCCRSHTLGAHLDGSIERGFDAVYVSDDELEDRDDPRFWLATARSAMRTACTNAVIWSVQICRRSYKTCLAAELFFARAA